MELKFYRCETCGKIVAIVKGTGMPTICCGKPMQEIVPGSVDASLEKHVPVFEVNGNTLTVSVGSVTHPSTEEHHIEWIALQTSSGNQRKTLKPGDEPKVCFSICDKDKIEAVYAFCNLHGLWKAK